MEYKNLRPTQIILDPDNPRLPDGTSSDKEAINRLLDDGYDQLLALARDLVEQGESNPAELPIVLKDGSKYLVLEGNRRFAALKLLSDPKLADNPDHQAAFTRIKAKGTGPTHVYSAVASTREQADHWIMLRHTGANQGVGIKRWNAQQTATHRRRMKANVDAGTLRSITIADELTETYQEDLTLVETIQRVRAAKLTNIGRFFAPDVLTRMQFEVRQVSGTSTRTLWARHTAEQLHDFFTWAMEMLDKKTVDAIKNEALRGGLLNTNSHLLPDPGAALVELRRLADHPYSHPTDEEDEDDESGNSGDPGDASETSQNTDTGTGATGSTDDESGDQSSGGGDSGSSGRKRDQAPEKHLYSKVRLPNLPPTVQRLLKEARSIPLDDHYATGCVLARAILELTVSASQVLKWSGAKDSDPLATKIKACVLKLDPDVQSPKKRTRADLVQAFQEADGIGVQYMHQFLHNPSVKPDPHLARRFSSAFTPLLIDINTAIAGQP